jgi:hypothetical protein
MQNTRYSCQISIKLEFCLQIFEKYSNLKFHANASSRSRVVPRGQMDGRTDGRTDKQTDMTKLIITFCSFADAPKSYTYTSRYSATPFSQGLWTRSCTAELRPAASTQTMNTVAAAASSVGAYMYMLRYEYNALLHIHCTYILCMDKRKQRLCQDHKINTLIKQCHPKHYTKHLPCTDMFENELFPTSAVQQRRQVDAVGCHKFLAS